MLLTMVLTVMALFLAMPDLAVQAAGQTAKAPVVVVLDPGHGGEDKGAVVAPFMEKTLNLYVSLLTKAELEQYDNVVVYMTRTDDTALTLKQRVDFAHRVGASLFVCQHFNYSPVNKSGSEVYVSIDPLMQYEGGKLARYALDQYSAAGLNVRGIYDRFGKHGDYYGVIRMSTAYRMPSVILEHCYLHNEADRAWLASKDSYDKLAHADATAIAEYLHLSSTKLGVDFSGLADPSFVVSPMTGPTIDHPGAPVSLQFALLTSAKANGNGTAHLQMYCVDSKDGIAAVSWSLDGGVTFSAPVAYENSNHIWELDIPAVAGQTVLLRAYTGAGGVIGGNAVVIQ